MHCSLDIVQGGLNTPANGINNNFRITILVILQCELLSNFSSLSSLWKAPQLHDCDATVNDDAITFPKFQLIPVKGWLRSPKQTHLNFLKLRQVRRGTKSTCGIHLNLTMQAEESKSEDDHFLLWGHSCGGVGWESERRMSLLQREAYCTYF